VSEPQANGARAARRRSRQEREAGSRLRALAALAVVATLALAGCTRQETRPSGIAERWLQAVSDLGRDGLREDAQERLEKYGTARPIEVPDAEEDERTFSDLEVGKATFEGDVAVVPFRVTARVRGDERRETTGVLQLVDDGDTWRVVQVLPAGPEDKVPSEGGERPARASLAQWLAAALAGLAMTVAAVVVIDRQPLSGRR